MTARTRARSPERISISRPIPTSAARPFRTLSAAEGHAMELDPFGLRLGDDLGCGKRRRLRADEIGFALSLFGRLGSGHNFGNLSTGPSLCAMGCVAFVSG